MCAFLEKTLSCHILYFRGAASMHIARLVGVPSLMLTLCTSGVANALECPVYHRTGNSSAIQETKARTRSFTALLAARGELAVPSIIESVRTAHPGASAAEVTNFLTTIYCPLILKDATLSDAEKRAHLKSFSADVFKKVPPT